MRTPRLLLLITSLAFTISIASPARPAGSSYLVRIPYKAPAQVRMLEENGIRVLHVSPRGYIDAAAREQDLTFLFSLGYGISVIASSDMSLASPTLGPNLGLYHTYAEMESTLTALESAHPGLAKVEVLGTSHEGRFVYGLKISDNVSVDEGEPEVLIVGNHHARELMSLEIPLKLAQYLLANYGSDSTVTYLVDNREIFIVPSANPDGHAYVEANHSGAWWSWWRKNRRDNGDGTYGVDLNRNYGYNWGYDNFGSSPYTSSEVYRGPSAFSEPETQAIRDLAQNHSFKLALSYHSYGELLLYPWGYAFAYTPDHALFLALADSLTSTNGYYPGNPAMGAIYITNGDTDDWAYGDDVNKNSFPSFTVEVNSDAEGGFAPPDTLIDPTFNLLLPMNMQLIDLAGDPTRVLGPQRPVMYPASGSSYGVYVLSWSPSPPSDSNPAVSYDLVEIRNLGAAVDHADTLSDSWSFAGFTSGTRAYEGQASYYSGSGNNLSNTMTTALFIPVTTSTDTLTCEVWYDIESNYDYAYLECSTDGGITWETVPGNITTNFDPYGSNHGNGITGSSGGWVQASFPLDAYLGQDVLLRFHYVTDGAVSNEGFYVDLIDPVPVYDTLATVAAGLADTTFAVIPDQVGTFTYRVRGRDAEGQLSTWSISQSFTVDQLTSVATQPAMASWLGSNYPNPFNPETMIPFRVGGAAGARVHVRLAVYTPTGRLVKILENRSLEPGLYRSSWDGTDESGRTAASGIYIARLIVDGRKQFTRKLVLLK